MGDVFFFSCKLKSGPTTLKVGQKGTWEVTGFMISSHPTQMQVNHKTVIEKGKPKMSYTFNAPGIYKLRFRETCPILGPKYHSKWTDDIIVTVIE